MEHREIFQRVSALKAYPDFPAVIELIKYEEGISLDNMVECDDQYETAIYKGEVKGIRKILSLIESAEMRANFNMDNPGTQSETDPET